MSRNSHFNQPERKHGGTDEEPFFPKSPLRGSKSRFISGDPDLLELLVHLDVEVVLARLGLVLAGLLDRLLDALEALLGAASLGDEALLGLALLLLELGQHAPGHQLGGVLGDPGDLGGGAEVHDGLGELLEGPGRDGGGVGGRVEEAGHAVAEAVVPGLAAGTDLDWGVAAGTGVKTLPGFTKRSLLSSVSKDLGRQCFFSKSN